MLLDEHYNSLIQALADGDVIPFLGAGINMCERPDEFTWTPQSGRLPSGGELSQHLASHFKYQAATEAELGNLVRVSQYAEVMRGSGPLYKQLRKVLDDDFPITPLHLFLAGLPVTLKAKDDPVRFQLIVTTNYDDVLERAFRAAEEEFDVVTYIAKGENSGKFLHWKHGEEKPQLIERPNEYLDIPLEKRTVILKIHGAIDRNDGEGDSYVITEDDYIDYLAKNDIGKLLPAKVLAKLRNSGFLFMGYGLRDWNLRVILHRIWGSQRLSYKSWAIQLGTDDFDKKFWDKHNVEILNSNLESYVAELKQRLQAFLSEGSAG